jgi:hypothetical protein
MTINGGERQKAHDFKVGDNYALDSDTTAYTISIHTIFF